MLCSRVRGSASPFWMVADLRAQERQAAEDWASGSAASRSASPSDVSPATITLAILLTDEELDAARHGEPAQVLPANTASPDGRPQLDGVIGWSRSLRGRRRRRWATEPQQIPSAGTWIWSSINGAQTWPNCPAAPAGCW